jgi:hypothetical protein
VGYRESFPKAQIESARALVDVLLKGLYPTRRTSYKRTLYERASYRVYIPGTYIL